MGCGQSLSPEQQEQRLMNLEIDKDIKKSKAELGREVKMLLLGSGGSGKSTVAKQMKLLYMDGFSPSESRVYTEIVYYNIVTAMKSLVTYAQRWGIALDSPDNEREAEEMRQKTVSMQSVALTQELASAIGALWKDSGVRKVWERVNEIQVDESAAYFFGELPRISAEGYTPNTDDILFVRSKTTGISETEFVVDDLKLRMVDVGGQRNERKKWIHAFQEVTAIIYVVSMAGYDKVIEEDLETNRMHESLKLFDDIVNNRWFQATPIILFLNMKDIFERKIKKRPLTVCFPEYTGAEGNYEEAAAYILNKFVDVDRKTRPREIYPHETTATDTTNVKAVFSAVLDIFLTEALDRFMMS